MYVKVHKKSNKWFREINGAFVGTEIPNSSPYYKNLAKKIGKQILIKDIYGETKTIYYGHFVNNKFVRLTPSNSLKPTDKTLGYYAFVLD